MLLFNFGISSPKISNRKIAKMFSYKIKKLKNTEIDEFIDEMLWLLRFNIYAKGTNYLKTAIFICLIDNYFLSNTNNLMQLLSQIHNKCPKTIRNNIDNAINSAFQLTDIEYHIKFYNGYYDGRKVSLKYFLNLSIKYIKKNLK